MRKRAAEVAFGAFGKTVSKSALAFLAFSAFTARIFSARPERMSSARMPVSRAPALIVRW